MIVGVCHELVLTSRCSWTARTRASLRRRRTQATCRCGHSGRYAAQAGRSDAMNATRRFRIAAIPADGVGQEVVAAGARRSTRWPPGASARSRSTGWNSSGAADTTGAPADDGVRRAVKILKDFDAIYFGAVGWPGVPDHVASLRGLRLAICQNFDQWANVRPVRFLPGVRSRCARPTTPNWSLGCRCGRTARASTPGWAAATSPGAALAARSPSSRPCSPSRLRAHHALRLRPGPVLAAAARFLASPRATPSSTAWSCGTRFSRRLPGTIPTSRPRASL